jgi:hypothetical protein
MHQERTASRTLWAVPSWRRLIALTSAIVCLSALAPMLAAAGTATMMLTVSRGSAWISGSGWAASARGQVTVTLPGTRDQRASSTTDSAGNFAVSFRLPKSARGEVTAVAEVGHLSATSTARLRAVGVVATRTEASTRTGGLPTPTPVLTVARPSPSPSPTGTSSHSPATSASAPRSSTPPTASDVTYHVEATSGSDASAGTFEAPFRTLAAGVRAALQQNAEGRSTTVRMRPGTYRESVVLPAGGTTAAMTIEATAPGVVFSGADAAPLDSWILDDAEARIYRMPWTARWGVQAWPAGWGDYATSQSWSDVIRRREMTFVDGSWLRQVLSYADLRRYDGAYFVDDGGSQLYMRLPSSALAATAQVEVSVRAEGLIANSRSNLTLRGLNFEKYATPMQKGAVSNLNGTAPVVDGCTFRLNSWGGYTEARTTRSRITNTRFNDNGVVGLLGFRTSDGLVEDSENNRNNTSRGAWAGYRDWEDGMKYTESRSMTLRRFTAMSNNAPGIWFDWDNTDVLIEDSTSAHNTSFGIFVEVTPGPVTLRRVEVTGNFRGLETRSARGVTITDSTFWQNNIEWTIAAVTPSHSLTQWDTGRSITIEPEYWTLTNNVFYTGAAGDRHQNSAYLVSDSQWGNFKASLRAAGNAYYSTVSTPFAYRINNVETRTDLAGWRQQTLQDGSSTFCSCAPRNLPSVP